MMVMAAVVMGILLIVIVVVRVMICTVSVIKFFLVMHVMVVRNLLVQVFLVFPGHPVHQEHHQGHAAGDDYEKNGAARVQCFFQIGNVLPLLVVLAFHGSEFIHILPGNPSGVLRKDRPGRATNKCQHQCIQDHEFYRALHTSPGIAFQRFVFIITFNMVCVSPGISWLRNRARTGRPARIQ